MRDFLEMGFYWTVIVMLLAVAVQGYLFLTSLL